MSDNPTFTMKFANPTFEEKTLMSNETSSTSLNVEEESMNIKLKRKITALEILVGLFFIIGVGSVLVNLGMLIYIIFSLKSS